MKSKIEEEEEQKSTMDLNEFRVILSKSKADVWQFIEMAITVAALDYGEELKDRRDRIIEKLFSSSGRLCRSCGNDTVDNHNHHHQIQQHQRNSKSPLTPESNHRIKEEDEEEAKEENHGNDEEGDLDPLGGLFDDDEESKIVQIRERLEDPNLSEESVIDLLQELADMDITFQALQDTDIGRHVNRFRKHSSNEVRQLVKLLVRKWKETVDEWVQSKEPDQASADKSSDGDSPQLNVQRRVQQNGYLKGSDFAYSPNPQNGGSSSERNYSEPEVRPKPVPPREAPSRPPQPASKSASAPPPSRPKDSTIDLEKLNSARRRLHENYQEAQNAKKQRTIQVMDIHEIPKPKNAFFAKNKGGFQGRHHR